MLVVGADDGYAMPLAVTLYSSLIHLSDETPVRIHVFDGGISGENRRRVERVVRDARPTADLQWHILDLDRLEGLRVTRLLTNATYLRLLIPEILAKEDIVVYLDSDLLVRHDLSTLPQEAGRSPESAISAVGDFRHADLGDVLGDQSCLDLGADPRAPYFNCGVLVIDVKGWRDMQVGQRAFAFLREHDSVLRHLDQDALNVVLAKQWHELDPRWNVMLPELRRYIIRERGELDPERGIRELSTSAFVFHFTGLNKPWEASYVGNGRKEYLGALWGSGWFESTIEHMLWRARLGTSTALWRGYRKLPETIRAKVRSVSRQS